jgi:hypothetical protein
MALMDTELREVMERCGVQELRLEELVRASGKERGERN